MPKSVEVHRPRGQQKQIACEKNSYQFRPKCFEPPYPTTGQPCIPIQSERIEPPQNATLNNFALRIRHFGAILDPVESLDYKKLVAVFEGGARASRYHLPIV